MKRLSFNVPKRQDYIVRQNITTNTKYIGFNARQCNEVFLMAPLYQDFILKRLNFLLTYTPVDPIY